MKTLMTIVVLAMFTISGAFAQNQVIALTFSGINNTSYFHPESIKVRNLTQGGDTVLVYPDTVLILEIITGIVNMQFSPDKFMFSEPFPNPVTEKAVVNLNVPGQDKVSFTTTDLLGRQLMHSEKNLGKGQHSFIFTPAEKGFYLLNATWRGNSKSIKILCMETNSGSVCTLEYSGLIGNLLVSEKSDILKQGFSYTTGDKLMYIGYNGELESAFIDTPETDQDYVFQFAANIPCPGLDSLLYDGKYYHTIQIFSQCWMKENLETGTMITGAQIQSDNGVVEKYCFSNNQENCEIYGGLYLWDEMMQYSTAEGGQGVCPVGWHVPTDEEWKILEGAADSYYGIGHPEWDNPELRGFDAGKNLKSTTGWSSNGNGTDLYGFTAVAGGYWWQGYFFESANFGIYWTSTPCVPITPWYRGMRMDMNYMHRRQNTYGNIGYSVRCLKD